MLKSFHIRYTSWKEGSPMEMDESKNIQQKGQITDARAYICVLVVINWKSPTSNIYPFLHYTATCTLYVCMYLFVFIMFSNPNVLSVVMILNNPSCWHFSEAQGLEHTYTLIQTQMCVRARLSMFIYLCILYSTHNGSSGYRFLYIEPSYLNENIFIGSTKNASPVCEIHWYGINYILYKCSQQYIGIEAVYRHMHTFYNNIVFVYLCLYPPFSICLSHFHNRENVYTSLRLFAE